MIITIKKDNKSLDIKADENLPIKELLDVIDKSGLMKIDKTSRITSQRDKTVLDTDNNLKENKVYGGDILKVE